METDENKKALEITKSEVSSSTPVRNSPCHKSAQIDINTTINENTCCQPVSTNNSITVLYTRCTLDAPVSSVCQKHNLKDFNLPTCKQIDSENTLKNVLPSEQGLPVQHKCSAEQQLMSSKEMTSSQNTVFTCSEHSEISHPPLPTTATTTKTTTAMSILPSSPKDSCIIPTSSDNNSEEQRSESKSSARTSQSAMADSVSNVMTSDVITKEVKTTSFSSFHSQYEHSPALTESLGTSSRDSSLSSHLDTNTSIPLHTTLTNHPKHTANTNVTQTYTHPQLVPKCPVIPPMEMNFFRFMFLILRRAPIAVRTYFDTRHPPLQLMTDLAINKESLSALRGKIISSQQWKTLYPPSGYVNSRHFDVTLLILLLRYMTNVPAPVTGFDKLPVQTDDSVGADLARIKHYRNLVSHSNNAKLTEEDFNDYWTEVEKVIGRLGGEAQLLEAKSLKESLIEEKDRELLLEINELRAQYQDTIPRNIKEQISDKLDKWLEEDTKFYETRACIEAEKLIQSEKCVTVTGNAGAGKSAIVHHIALKMQRYNYVVLPIKVPSEFLQYFDAHSDQIFVIDDPCGEKCLDVHLANEWKRYEDDIIRSLSKNDKTRLLISCRLSISRTHHYKDINLFDEVEGEIVNLVSAKFSLTREEKMAIYKSHTSDEFQLSKKILDLHDCFPLLCKLISTNMKFKKNIKRFLKFPYKEYDHELDVLRHHPTPYEYCALALCIFFDNGIQLSHLQKGKDEKVDEIFDEVYEECCLEQGTSRKRIKLALEALTDSFIIKDDDAYKLLHAKLTEIIACHFAKESLHLLIKFAPMWILDARLRNPSCMSIKDIDESGYFILLNSLCKPVLAERILNCLESESICSHQKDSMKQMEDVYDLLFNFCFPDDQIETLLFDGLKSNGKLNFLLHKRNCIENPRIMDYIEYKKELKEQEYEKEELKELEMVHQKNWIPVRSITRIIAVYNGNMPNFYRNVSARQLLEINENNFLFWLVGAGWTNFLVRSLEVADTVLKDELFICKNSAFLLSLFSGNVHMVKFCFKLLGPDFNGTYTCFLCKQTCDSSKHLRHNCLVEGLNFVTVPCLIGKKEILEFLLTERICNRDDLNKFVCYQYQSVTPLTAACKIGHTDIVNLLIQNGALVNLKDKNDTFEDELEEEGWSALWWACYGGYLTSVSYLLDKGADIHNTNKAGKTPLWAAIQSKNYEVVALLMKKGLNVNEQDKNGRTPIWWASNVGQHEILYLFQGLKGDVNIYDNNDISPLYTACYRNNIKTAEVLIKHGAKINANHPSQPSPLIGACCMKDIELVSLLIGSGADVNSIFEGICSPLSIATWSSFESGMTILLENGAKINMKLNKGQTVLIQCIWNIDNFAKKLRYRLHDIKAFDDLCFNFYPDTSEDFPALVSLLIKYGADLNCQDDNGLTALMGAVLYNRECTKLLLENGASVNLQEKDSRTALHNACLRRNHATVLLLTEYGASIDAKDVHGFTPSHIACELLDEKTIKILLNKGADINVIDNNGFTPLLRLLYLEASKKDSKKGNNFNGNDEEKRSNCVVAIALKLLDHGADPMVRALDCDAWFLAKVLDYKNLTEALCEKIDEINATGKY
ncbi:uncharacterized protein LOC134244239 isoform X2 [Saccostrea cucullata]|uniref:uncharacterized protein LOC134244239 isoform X2 n=1 Tax=Saccostrea cuccullata TaxID=36930 RepID=UPI002ED6A5AC